MKLLTFFFIRFVKICLQIKFTNKCNGHVFWGENFVGIPSPLISRIR